MNKNKKLAKIVCTSMIIGNITPVFATITNETSTYDDTTEQVSKQTEVLYQKAGNYFVTIPKTISLGIDKQSPYSVKVEGDIPSDKQVYVSPIDGITDTETFDFYMHDQSAVNPKADVVATVTQNKFYWNFSEVADGYSETDNQVIAEDLTSGHWKGTFDFEINMKTKDDNIKLLKPGLYNAKNELVLDWEEGGSPQCMQMFATLWNKPEVTKIVIPDSETSIYYAAFMNCTSLTDIVIPESITTISSCAFDGCTSLTNLEIPNSVKTIGENAFQNVPHITYYGTATGSPWGAKSIN